MTYSLQGLSLVPDATINTQGWMNGYMFSFYWLSREGQEHYFLQSWEGRTSASIQSFLPS